MDVMLLSSSILSEKRRHKFGNLVALSWFTLWS